MKVKGITERQRTLRLGKQSKYKRKTIDTKSKKRWSFATKQTATNYLKFLKEKKNE